MRCCEAQKQKTLHYITTDGWAEIIPFRYLPVLLGGKGTSHVGWDTGDLPSQGEKLRVMMMSLMMMSFICSYRNKIGADLHIYLEEG